MLPRLFSILHSPSTEWSQESGTFFRLCSIGWWLTAFFSLLGEHARLPSRVSPPPPCDEPVEMEEIEVTPDFELHLVIFFFHLIPANTAPKPSMFFSLFLSYSALWMAVPRTSL